MLQASWQSDRFALQEDSGDFRPASHPWTRPKGLRPEQQVRARRDVSKSKEPSFESRNYLQLCPFQMLPMRRQGPLLPRLPGMSQFATLFWRKLTTVPIKYLSFETFSSAIYKWLNVALMSRSPSTATKGRQAPAAGAAVAVGAEGGPRTSTMTVDTTSTEAGSSTRRAFHSVRPRNKILSI